MKQPTTSTEDFRISRPILAPIVAGLVMFGGMALMPLALLQMSRPPALSSVFSQRGARGFGDLVAGRSSNSKNQPGSSERNWSGKDLSKRNLLSSSRHEGSGIPALTIKRLQFLIQKLHPLFTPQKTPQPGDWRYQYREKPQSFVRYLKSKPVMLTKKRFKLIVQPLGKFTPEQTLVLHSTARYLSFYYNTTVEIKKALKRRELRSIQKRRHHLGVQWNTRSILNHILLPRLPDDAFAIIGITTQDLWPGNNWNFVFGEASIRERVGVYSMARMGDLTKKDGYNKVLLRMLKTASHETGHMLSVMHCTAYECNMAGANSLQEMDRHPIFLCPHDMAKIAWATQTAPQIRYRHLCQFFNNQKMPTQYKRCQQLYKAVKSL